MFDRYLRTYAKQNKRKQKESDSAIDLKEFRVKWAEFVTDEVHASDDLRPLLGLDAYEAPPKPYKIH